MFWSAKLNLFYSLEHYILESKIWSKLQPAGEVPSGRTAHAATVVGKKLYVFGGMSSIGSALDEFYVLNTGDLLNHAFIATIQNIGKPLDIAPVEIKWALRGGGCIQYSS